MGKLLKFLKPHAAAVFAVLCVLIVQAFCDLSLPSYTSDIVNVGIQQGGIDEAVPEKIGEDELERLLLFVPSGEKDAVRDAYKEAKDSGPAYGGHRSGTEGRGKRQRRGAGGTGRRVGTADAAGLYI